MAEATGFLMRRLPSKPDERYREVFTI